MNPFIKTIKIEVDNMTSIDFPIQIELTGLTRIIKSNNRIIIDTDLPGEDIQIQITKNGLVIFGGVDASFVEW